MNLTFEEFVPNFYVRIFLSMILAFGITYRSIPVIINVCNLKGLMAEKEKRSSHLYPTPTFGGIALFAATLISYHIWNFGDEGILMHRVIVGFIILFFLGIKDDLFALAPIKKIVSQVIAAGLVVIGSDLRITDFFGIFGIYEIPYALSVALTIFIFIALINAINLIDGIDGLAGGVGMIVTAFFGLWFLINGHFSLASLSLCLSSSLAGFLRYNFSKTNKIFMGDTGSLILGFVITTLAVKFIHYNVLHSFRPALFVNAPVLAIVLLSVPIFDTIRVFAIRTMRGKSPFKADRIHMHHLVVDNGLNHMQASMTFYAYTIFATTLTYILRHYLTNTQLCLIIVVYFILYLITGYWLENRRLNLKKIQVKAQLQKHQNGQSVVRFDSEAEENPPMVIKQN